MWKWLLFFDMSVDKWPNIKGINKLKAFFANLPFEIGKTLLKILATKYLEGEDIVLLCTGTHIESKEFKEFIEPLIDKENIDYRGEESFKSF